MSVSRIDLVEELEFKTVRSGGPGGQHVNKVETKVELYFDVNNSKVLTEDQKESLLKKLSAKLSKEGILIIASQSERSQFKNKKKVIDKFYELIEKGLRKPKKRVPTKRSKSANEKRLLSKKRDAEIKKLRKKDW